MLITFRSSATGPITMFGDAAKQLLIMMGQSGASPGAILASDIPAAVARLKKALAENQPPPLSLADEDRARERDGGPPVSLAKRAVPLIHLLEEAAKADAAVTWGS